MSDLLAYADGRLQPASSALAAREDEFLAVAEGAFETLLRGSAGLRDAAAHWERLERALATLGLEPARPPEPIPTIAESVARSVPAPLARLRIGVGRHHERVRTWITAQPYRPQSPREPVVLAVSDAEYPVTALRGIKSLAWRRTALALQARYPGAFDVVVCGAGASVQEGSRSSLFVRLGSRIVTPPLSDGCLPGTVRRRLLESDRVREETVSLEALLEADEVAIGNSLAGVMPVERIGESKIEVGSLAADLEETWLQEIG